jgi:hypothetical protein
LQAFQKAAEVTQIPRRGQKRYMHATPNMYDPYPDYEWFAVVRNPFDRLVSMWRHYRRLGHGIGLDVFLRDGKVVGSRRPMVRFVDFRVRVFRYEHWPELAEYVEAKTGHVPELVNAAPERRDYREFYTDYAREHVLREYGMDFDRFGYVRDLYG